MCHGQSISFLALYRNPLLPLFLSSLISSHPFPLTRTHSLTPFPTLFHPTPQTLDLPFLLEAISDLDRIHLCLVSSLTADLHTLLDLGGRVDTSFFFCFCLVLLLFLLFIIRYIYFQLDFKILIHCLLFLYFFIHLFIFSFHCFYLIYLPIFSSPFPLFSP